MSFSGHKESSCLGLVHRLERLPVTQEAAGSSPVAPANFSTRNPSCRQTSSVGYVVRLVDLAGLWQFVQSRHDLCAESTIAHVARTD